MSFISTDRGTNIAGRPQMNPLPRGLLVCAEPFGELGHVVDHGDMKTPAGGQGPMHPQLSGR